MKNVAFASIENTKNKKGGINKIKNQGGGRELKI
jgi:hypothetical protein